ncbi:MAG: hypothetical protein LE178_05365, partial [Endomicrobium sp.]|nr:hypothetical protein [Endomicrobium sp.]
MVSPTNAWEQALNVAMEEAMSRERTRRSRDADKMIDAMFLAKTDVAFVAKAKANDKWLAEREALALAQAAGNVDNNNLGDGNDNNAGNIENPFDGDPFDF